MKHFKLFVVATLSLLTYALKAQTPCNTLGQNPSTAFPVCGTSVFSQSTVPLCGGRSVPAPNCGGALYSDINPFWYRFTCFQAGTLGFKITPLSASDDYDWQIYDITGKDPNTVVYSDVNAVVGCGWSGEKGVTGASSAGNNLFVCGGLGQALFSAMPTLTVGHTYIMLVSNFSSSQQGYSLSFEGGTAVITDPAPLSLKEAKPKCDSREAVIKISKRIRCSSIALDGSDFTLTPAVATVVKAEGLTCSASFDTDSLLVTFDQPLPPGNYTLVAKNGTDNNTILDLCNVAIPVNDQVTFSIKKLEPTHVDSLVPVKCAPDKLVLVFKKNIQCATIAPDGSDFFITGPYPVDVIAASGNCNTDGTTSTITVTLSQPVNEAGTFTIKLKNGLDGNPIVDECGVTTPIGEGQTFSVKDTVNAAFDFTIDADCKRDRISYFHDGDNGVTNWAWTFDNSATSDEQNPQRDYTTPGTKTVQLIVTNGFCSDTSTQSFTLSERPRAIISGPDLICPEDTALFIDKSVNATSWSWNFGNGVSSAVQNPPAQLYPKINKEKVYTISLAVSDGNCTDTAYYDLTVVKSCYIDIPSAFTPNGDKVNDYLYPLNAYKADNLEFKVYNRYGQLVFETNDWKVKWDGTINGNLQPAGTYVWFLKYKNRDTGKNFSLKGTTVLIR